MVHGSFGISPGYVLADGPRRRQKDAEFVAECFNVDELEWVPSSSGQFAVILFSVAVKVKLPKCTTSAPLSVLIQRSSFSEMMLLLA